MNGLMQDLRYAFRQLAKNPGFAAIAVVTLALGIGANTALFSVVQGVLFKPLPYRQPQELVALYAHTAEFEHSSIAYPNFLDWQRHNHSFSAMAAFRSDDLNLIGLGEPERLKANMVSAGFFQILGVQPVAGREFNQQEDQLGGAPVALISEGLWKRKFGGARDVIGKGLTLDAKSYTVVGVVPASFHYENDNFYADSDVYVPLGQWSEPLFRDRHTAMGMDGVGRLKPGVTLDQAKEDMRAVAAHLAEIYPDSNKNSGVTLVPLKQNVVGDIQPFLLVLLAAVGFVLLIACANVANLLLARSTARAHEFTMRTALGASRVRIIRQVLTESVVLAWIGGLLGLLVAALGTQAAIRVLPEALPRAQEIHLSGSVLLFTFGASMMAGLLFGLMPALKTSRTNLQETLKESGRGTSGRHRTQGTIVAMEIALALVLLAGAGLMIRSLGKLWSINPGFDPGNVVRFGLAAGKPLGETPASVRATLRQLRDAIAAIPGVQAVSLTVGASPMHGDSELPLWLEGEPKPASQAEMKTALFYATQPDYLKVMKIPLLRGRYLTDGDNENALPVVVVDEEFAKRYFGNRDPIGQHIHFEILNVTAEVVGIAGHIKQWGLGEEEHAPVYAQCYLPMAQIPDSFLTLLSHGVDGVLRTQGAMDANARTIRRAVATVNSQIAVYDTQTMSEIVAESLAAQRFAMVLLGVFAALATVLASVGIYGVISYITSQRAHEMGIRMALGAARTDVLRIVLSQAGRIAIIGVGIGVVASFGLMRLMANLLFGVSPHDPLTFLGMALLLASVALLASYIPARRAAKVDPVVALRYE